MAKKEYKDLSNYVSFNKREARSTAKATTDLILEETQHVAFDNNVNIELWPSVNRMTEQVEKTWNSEFGDHFRRWWLDALVKECSYILYNALFESLRQQDGYTDKKADQEAELIIHQFLKKFE